MKPLQSTQAYTALSITLFVFGAAAPAYPDDLFVCPAGTTLIRQNTSPDPSSPVYSQHCEKPDGTLDGPKLRYFGEEPVLDANISELEEYRGGQQDGYSILWYSDQDVMRSRSTYHQLNPQGAVPLTGYSRRKSESYYREGKLHGTQLRWYSNGNLEEESEYREGELHGWSRIWHENGQIKQEGRTQHGAQDGLWSIWDAQGQKLSEEHYLLGQREGLFVSWYPDGQKKEESLYQNNALSGAFSRWHPNGMKSEEGFYQDGLRAGPWFSWYESGLGKEEGSYEGGKKEGLWSYWYESGAPQKQGSYLKGKLHGEWTFWDESGGIERVERYNSDNLYAFTQSKPVTWVPLQGDFVLGGVKGPDDVGQFDISGYLGYTLPSRLIPARAELSITHPERRMQPFLNLGAELVYSQVGEICEEGAPCHTKTSFGPALRAGLALRSTGFLTKAGRAAPLLSLYAQLSPYAGAERTEDGTQSGVFGLRAELGLTALGWSRAVVKAMEKGARKSEEDEILQIFLLPLALLNHIELNFDIPSDPLSAGGVRVGAGLGFGF